MANANSIENTLSMLGKSFVFKDLKPVHPTRSYIGEVRVVAVVVHLDGHCDLGLSDDPDDDMFEFYPLDRLELMGDRVL